MNSTTIQNGGLELQFLSYGGAVTRLATPDRFGRLGNVVLGFKSAEDYAKPQPYFGALVGRFSGRMSNARFKLDDVEYRLTANNGRHSLAGGANGFDKREWEVEVLPGAKSARLTLVSPDGDEGYPGQLAVAVTYSLTAEGAFRIDYEAKTDRTTVLNLTNHSYFNLAGDGAGSIENQILEIASDRVLEVDAELIPTGAILPVEGTPVDFRKALAIGARIRSSHPLTRNARGYDHSFLLANEGRLELAARVYDPTSGRIMQVYTTEPSIAFYSGNFLDGSLIGGSDRQFRQGDGFCLEPRHLPDSPNKPHFPSTTLRPGDVFRATTEYRFSADG